MAVLLVLSVSVMLSFPLYCIPVAQSIPFIVFHGISECCKSRRTTKFTERLSNWSGSEGYCVEIGDGAHDSWVIPLMEQIEIACRKVKDMSVLSEGYNMVGLSQGNMVGRGVIEFCDGPPVKNLISLAGPHAGIAAIPYCKFLSLCTMLDNIIMSDLYINIIQDHLAPTNYFKIPTDICAYQEGCKFLPKLNNEIANKRNSSYRERFAALENLILIMFENDELLVPKETSWFGYYRDDAFDEILPVQQTKLYLEDWIGLKTLDEAGKVKFVSVKGGHLDICVHDMKKYIVPYLDDRLPMSVTKSSSYVAPSPSSDVL